MIDTFLMRTLLVPCVMLTLKEKNWWPRKVPPVCPAADADAQFRAEECGTAHAPPVAIWK